MAPIKHSLIITICSILIHSIKSQLIVCSGGPGSACFCPPASDPAVSPGEICVLDCGRPDMCEGHTLTCRAGDPCYINCAGKGSCADQTIINANGATDVTVRCSHEDSCKTDIHIGCGTGDCLLECVRFGSCLEFGWVDTRFSKSWTCNGLFCPWALLPLPYSPAPTPAPSPSPTSLPTKAPTSAPTFSPSRVPTDIPTNSPTLAPTSSPTKNPTHSTAIPTISPTKNPSNNPTTSPTIKPTFNPTTLEPTVSPTIDPTYNPTISPSKSPTIRPSSNPTPVPTMQPTTSPTDNPTVNPTKNPTLSPTDPTDNPTNYPTVDPTNDPTLDPTLDPTEPTEAPSRSPIVYDEAAAAEFLNSTGWTALISVLTISVFCFIVILIAVIFYKKYQKDKEYTQKKMMAGIAAPDIQPNISPDTDATRDTDMQVVDGLETTGKMASISELDLHVLHSLNAYHKQDRKRMAATNGGKQDGEDIDFQIDANLVSAFMFGGGTDGFGEDEQDTGNYNPFRDGFEETGADSYDNYNGNFINPFDEDKPNELQQADSIDEMGLLQQRVKLMRLLQQQYELMNDYNIDYNIDAAHGQQLRHGQKNGDHNVDMRYL